MKTWEREKRQNAGSANGDPFFPLRKNEKHNETHYTAKPSVHILQLLQCFMPIFVYKKELKFYSGFMHLLFIISLKTYFTLLRFINCFVLLQAETMETKSFVGTQEFYWKFERRDFVHSLFLLDDDNDGGCS